MGIVRKTSPRGGQVNPPGTLILLRHGQSTWNLENLFTGWHDVPLSDRGVAEAIDAGRLIKEAGLAPEVVHTSVLVRAIETADLTLGELELTWIPVRRHSYSTQLRRSAGRRHTPFLLWAKRADC